MRKANPPARRERRPSRRKVAPPTRDGATSTIVFRPATPAAVAQLRGFCESPELPRETVSRQPLSEAEIAKLVGRGLTHRPLPVDVRVRFRGDRWVHLIPPPCIGDDAEDAALQSTAVNAIVFERLGERRIVRASEKGKSTLTLEATDDANAPARIRFISKKHSTAFLMAVQSADEAAAATLRRLGASPRTLAVEHEGDVIRLRALDRRPLRPADVQDVWLTTYVPVSERDGTIGPTLQRAIERGDRALIRRAVGGGARLDYLVGSLVSPLEHAMFRRGKKGGLDAVRALLDAGASLDRGGPHDDPAIVTVANASGAQEESTIALIDVLLSRGASIESRGRSAMNAGKTPLHAAASAGMIGVAMFLVARGADVAARLTGRLRASGLTRPTHAFLGAEHAALREFLLAAEAGAARPTVAQARAMARKADAYRAGVRDAIAGASPFAAAILGTPRRRGKARRAAE